MGSSVALPDMLHLPEERYERIPVAYEVPKCPGLKLVLTCLFSMINSIPILVDYYSG